MREPDITGKMIRKALRRGGRIDGSSLVLKRTRGKVVLSNRVWGVHRPPYLVAGYQFEPFGERWPDETEPQGWEQSWGVREFERLSLAARARLSIRNRGRSAKTIERWARTAGLDLDAFPVIHAEDIIQELAKVADELGPDQGRRGKVPTEDQLAMRGGLQLIGCRIVSAMAGDGLRLVNARLPVSLRFIGCVFECPLLLAHCELVSLDLSGSALDTLDATGLRASGSVYLRRTVVRTPTSFSAARINGAFNASDAVIAPMAPASLTTAVNPDHGILNLAGATIDNEVRFDRARLWGGLSLRGAILGRSLNLSHALIMSPLALLEKRLGDLLGEASQVGPVKGDPLVAPDARLTETIELVRRMSSFDNCFAKFLHAPEKPVGASAAKAAIGQMSKLQAKRLADDIRPKRLKAIERLEVLSGETDRWRALTARTLLKLSSRALTSAVRADNLRVSGTLNARAMVCGGQFRMKYADIQGAARFDGAILRAAGHYRQAIDAVLAHEQRRPSQKFRLAEAIDGLRVLEAWTEAQLARSTRVIQEAQLALGEATNQRERAEQRRREAAARRNAKKQTNVRDSTRAALERLEKAVRHSIQPRTALHLAERLLEKSLITWRFQDLWASLTGDDSNSGAARKRYFDHRWRYGEHWAALNLRDSRFAGDLSFGTEPWRRDSPKDPFGFRDISDPVELYGSVLLDSVSTGGSVLMNRMMACAPEMVEVEDSLEGSGAAIANTDSRGRRRKKSLRYQITRLLFREKGKLRRQDRIGLKTRRKTLLRTVQMRQANVGRDVDVQCSAGLAGFDLENAAIGGDLKFASQAIGRRRDTDSRSRFFTCDGRAEKVGGVVCLRSTRIAGDAILVFDPRRGPDIDASMATIQGRLEIDPQVGATSYQFSRAPKSAKAAQKGFWVDACDHERESRPRDGATPPWRTCALCNVVFDTIDASLAWTIDLSRARATVFAHPPAAWPDPGALTLDGFVYQQVAESGPLHPRQRVTETDTYEEHRWQRFAWRAHPLDSLSLGFFGAVMASLAFGFGAGPAWRLLPARFSLGQLAAIADWWSGATLVAMALTITAIPIMLISHLDRPSANRSTVRFGLHVVMTGGFLAGLYWVLRGLRNALASHAEVVLIPVPALSFIVLAILIAILITTASRFLLKPGWSLSHRWPFVNAHVTTPRAIEYLRRQKVVESRFKWRSSGHPVLETYIRAAKVLREGGRFVSANAVEEERLRLRTRMLSWRHHGAAKLILILVDIFAGYGFRLWRATLTLALVTCGVAVIGHTAAATGFLARERFQEAPFNHRALAPIAHDNDERGPDLASPATAGIPPLHRPACGAGNGPGAGDQDCPDFVYAADLLLPFIDLKEANRWKATIPEDLQPAFRTPAPGHAAAINEPWRSLLASLLYLWPSLVGVLGLVLTAVVGAAAASRIESAFARVEE